MQAEQEECLLSHTEILSSEYESKSETSIGSTLSLTLLLLLLLTSRISQHNYSAIIRQLQEQLVAQQAQIQALLGGAERGVGEEAEVRTISLDVAKLQLFNGALSKVSGFITECKLYIRNKLAGATIEGQIQWVLLHVQEESANI